MMDKNKILIKEKSSPLIQTDGVQDRKIKIEEYIFLHFPNQITEDDLAKEMHLSKRQLSRVIDKLFGKTFKQMLCDVRLNRAAQLLIESDASVDDIAYSVGYTSLSGFYTAFRGKFSLSAGQYRRAFNTK
jgi:AraC-like DNA-binding protein